MLDKTSNIPQIDLKIAPEEEHGNLRLLNFNLNEILRFVDQFGSALHLFDYCSMQESIIPSQPAGVFFRWKLITCRDAAMSIYHFRNVIEGAHNLANQSPYVGPKLNTDLLDEAHSKFERWFPDYAKMRHAVAHAGELAKNKGKSKQHWFSGDHKEPGLEIENSTGILVQDSLLDRRFTSTFKGKIVHCDMSPETFMRLRDIGDCFYRAFIAPTAATAQGGAG
jgi:hypothetical protein